MKLQCPYQATFRDLLSALFMVTGQCRAVFFPWGSAQVQLSQMSQPAPESAKNCACRVESVPSREKHRPWAESCSQETRCRGGENGCELDAELLWPCMQPPPGAASPYGSTDLDPSYLDGGLVGNQLPLEALLLLQQVLNPLKVPPVVLGAHT